MSSEFPPPPPPVPPRSPVPPPPPPANPRPSPPPTPSSDSIPPLSFSITPFPPPPPPAPAPITPPAPTPAPVATPPLPPPSPARLSPKTRLALILGTAALVLLIAAGLTWSHLRKRVPDSELIAWLRTQSHAGLSIGQLTTSATPQSDGSTRISFQATGTVPETLYVREDTSSHLRRTLDLAPASPSAVREAAAADTRIRERAGISDTPPDPLEAIVLRESTSAGTSFPFSGLATATRVDGQWRFTLLQGTLASPDLEGKPRSSFGEKTYLVGNASDDAALKELVEKQTDALARLEKAAAEILQENKRDREFLLARFHERITPGTLFTGTADLASGHSEPISLEITAAKPGSDKLTALLRNNSGWLDARPLNGTWKLDDATGILSITLSSRAGQAIASAGPLLESKEALTLALTFSDDNTLASPAGSPVAIKAALIDSDKLAATKSKLTTRLDIVLEATRPDTLYHGTATPKTGDATAEKIFLRFTKLTDGTAITAFFESAEAGVTAKRELRGSITDNFRRASNHPIRLQMPGSGRSRSARPGTLFSHVADTSFALKIDGPRLTGEDAAFTYELTRVSAAQAATLKKAVEASADALAASLPRTSGLHVQINDEWTALPRNGGSSSGGFVKSLFSKKDSDKPPVLTFKGDTPPPVVSGEKLTLTFKGKLPSRAKGVPADYPLIEAAKTTVQSDGTRTAPLEKIGTTFNGFGTTRLATIVAQPTTDALTLTFDQSLEPGTYAVLVGTDGYEFTVK